jgi:hypothetical protein
MLNPLSETRLCRHCNRALPLTPDFFPHASDKSNGIKTPHGKLQTWCRDCRREYLRKAVQQKRDNGAPPRKSRGYLEARAFVDKIKLDRGCADCGYNKHPAALEFDHLPGFEKTATIAAMVVFGNLEKIQAEIDKCEIVCANCHRIRSASRREQGLVKMGRPRLKSDFQSRRNTE